MLISRRRASTSDHRIRTEDSGNPAVIYPHEEGKRLGIFSEEGAVLFELAASGSDFLFWVTSEREGGIRDYGFLHGPGSSLDTKAAVVDAVEDDERGPAAGVESPCSTHETVLSGLMAGSEILEAIDDVMRSGQSVTCTARVGQEEAGMIWEVRLTLAGVSDTGIVRVVGAARDITQEMRRNEHVQEVVYLYRSLINLLPDAVSIIDSEGDLQYVNRAGAHLIGAAGVDDVLGRSYWDFVHPEDSTELREKASNLREGRSLDVSSCRMVRMDGSVVPVELASVPIKYNGQPAVLGTGRDLSSEHRLQRELQLVSHAVESMDDPIAIVDPEGRSVYHNPAFVRTFGYKEEALTEHGGLRTLFQDGEVATDVVSSLRGGNSWKGDAQLMGASDEVLSMAIRMNAVRGGSGQPIGVVCIFTDITERRQMRQQLVAAKEEAEEIARLRSTILTNLTHEVRTPLTVILGFTSMLRQGVKKKYTRFVDLIERSGRRLLLMLDAILDLAQLEAGSLDIVAEPFNVVDVADGVVGTLQTLAHDKNIELRLEAAERSIPARLDHQVLGRILNNLLDNAIKFTSEGCVRLVVEREEEWVKLAIIDTGVGIDEDFLPHIFDEFKQESTGLERTHQGSGLGLAVSERLIRHMGGSIDVSSEKNVGTTFIVRLPANMEGAS